MSGVAQIIGFVGISTQSDKKLARGRFLGYTLVILKTIAMVYPRVPEKPSLDEKLSRHSDS